MRNWSLKTKLLAFSVLSTALMLGLGGIGIYSLERVSEPYDVVAQQNVPKLMALSELYLAQKDAVISAVALVGVTSSPDELKSSREAIERSRATIEASIKTYESRFRSEEESRVYEEAKATFEPVLKGCEKIAELSAAGTVADVTQRDKFAATEFMVIRKQFREKVDKLMDLQGERVKLRVSMAEAATRESRVMFLVCIAIGSLLALGIGYFFARSLSDGLLSIAQILSGGANEVASAATQLSGTSTELSASASQQAAAIQQTSAAIEEISSMVARNSDNAASSDETARSSEETARRGQQAVELMIGSVKEIEQSNLSIKAQVDESNQQMARIVMMIKAIGEKTKVINDIVFQTKLLSFNASVEAARAGEAGKGFAVVAEEVGSLAQMSGKASQEISGMLDESIRDVERIVEETRSKVDQLMNSGRTKIEVGARTAVQCGKILDEIVASSNRMATSVNEISSACAEQTKGTQEISRAMTQLDQATHQNSAASEQAASASNQLSSQAELLRDSVSDLVSLVNGRGSAAHAPPPPKRKDTKPKARASSKKADDRSVDKLVDKSVSVSSDDPRWVDAA